MKTWPPLFPMVKSAARAMDAVQAFAQQEYQEKVENSWSAALPNGLDNLADRRGGSAGAGDCPDGDRYVEHEGSGRIGRRKYGKPSEQVHDYTDLHLLEKLTSRRW